MRKALRWSLIGCGGSLALLVIIVIVIIIAADGDSNVELNIAADIKAIAISSISDYPEVIDAAISQDDRGISLVLVVAFGTDEGRAKELGDNFVRMLKSFSEDSPPGKDIGKGMYDYLIGVYYPDEMQVALGAKARSANRISW